MLTHYKAVSKRYRAGFLYAYVCFYIHPLAMQEHLLAQPPLATQTQHQGTPLPSHGG